MGYSYRHSAAPDDVIFTRATLQGRPGDPDAILAEMERITRAREASQPIREKTGGSTFKNPPGMKAWELIDRAGCRGLVVGDAQVSTMHCNFLINRGHATAADLESLGEEVRRRVRETSGVTLEWEIKRIGRPVSSPRQRGEGGRRPDEGRRRPRTSAPAPTSVVGAAPHPTLSPQRASDRRLSLDGLLRGEGARSIAIPPSFSERILYRRAARLTRPLSASP